MESPVAANEAGHVCCTRCGNTIVDPAGMTLDAVEAACLKHRCPPPELWDTEQLRELGLL